MRPSGGPFTKGLLLRSLRRERGEDLRRREGGRYSRWRKVRGKSGDIRASEKNGNEARRRGEREREIEQETGRRREDGDAGRAAAIHVETRVTCEWEAICGESRSIRHSSSVSGIPRSPNRRRASFPRRLSAFHLFPFPSLSVSFLFFLFSSLYIRRRARYYGNKRSDP